MNKTRYQLIAEYVALSSELNRCAARALVNPDDDELWDAYTSARAAMRRYVSGLIRQATPDQSE